MAYSRDTTYEADSVINQSVAEISVHMTQALPKAPPLNTKVTSCSKGNQLLAQDFCLSLFMTTSSLTCKPFPILGAILFNRFFLKIRERSCHGV